MLFSLYFCFEFVEIVVWVWDDVCVGVVCDGDEVFVYFFYYLFKDGIVCFIGVFMSDYQGVIVGDYF